MSFNDEGHCSLVTEILDEALDTAHAGLNVFNVGSFHFCHSFLYEFVYFIIFRKCIFPHIYYIINYAKLQ